MLSFHKIYKFPIISIEWKAFQMVWKLADTSIWSFESLYAALSVGIFVFESGQWRLIY